MTDSELAILRRAYARHIAFLARGYDRREALAASADDPRLEQALLDVRRDAFVGGGPWLIAGAWPRRTPDAEPHWLYQDVTVALAPEKALNNGQPSFLAFLIGLARIQPGEHVVHVGAGVGYYTAIMAELAGRAGWVTAIELEPELAARAAANLKAWPQVEVVCADGSAHRPAPADVVFVNAGAARPMDVWLDALKDGGRLMLPLCVGYRLPDGTPMTRGGVFLVERQGKPSQPPGSRRPPSTPASAPRTPPPRPASPRRCARAAPTRCAGWRARRTSRRRRAGPRAPAGR